MIKIRPIIYMLTFLFVFGASCCTKNLKELADLVLTITGAPAQVVLGEILDLTTTVINKRSEQGCSETEPSEETDLLAIIFLKVDGMPEDQWPEMYRNHSIRVSPLGADNEFKEQLTFTPPQVGAYRLIGFVDTDDSVLERGEKPGEGLNKISGVLSIESLQIQEESNNFFSVDFDVVSSQ